jgi:DNA-binding FadR family transcriptional regulator
MAEARHEWIAEQLRGDILRGAYPAGVRLPAERQLAQRLGANRSSVREALRTLEQSGLVEIRHGGGATVQPLRQASLDVIQHLLVLDGVVNRPLLEQVLEVHEMLIVEAARLAVEHASGEQAKEARALLAVAADPATADDDYIDAIEALLSLIAESSGNLVLLMARRAVNPLFQGSFREARKRFRAPHEVIAAFTEALGVAIETRDADLAALTVRRFIRAGRSRALDALEEITRPAGDDPR